MTDPKQLEKPQSPYVSTQEVHLRLDKLEMEVKEIGKFFKTIQRSLDAIYGDRDLITDVLTEIHHVRGAVIDTEKHNIVRANEIKEVLEVKVDEVKKKVDFNLRTFTQNIISGIYKSFTKDDAKLKKRSFWNRLTMW